MLAIYKREVKSYFTSMIGYVFIAFFLLIVGFVFSYINVRHGDPLIGTTMNYAYVTLVFMILVPVITMRILADEKRLKTDQLLLTAPVSIVKIVIGKYLAVLTVLAIPMAVICIYPWVLSNFGETSYAASYISIAGFFLMGMAYLAIGIFISSLTESQVISAVGTFAVLLISFSMESLLQIIPASAISSFAVFIVLALILAGIAYGMTKNIKFSLAVLVLAEAAVIIVYIVKQSLYEGLIQKVMMVLSLTNHFDGFVNGLIEISAIVYYLSVAGLFVFLTVQSLYKRRWN